MLYLFFEMARLFVARTISAKNVLLANVYGILKV